MYEYSMWQWIMFFIIYCFVGWVYESIYVSIEHKKLVNRGFLNGPFLPIYGFGAIIMLFAALPVRGTVPLVFICGSLGATVLEYFTGFVMEKMFHVKYWDYSKQPLNLNGYICFGCSMMWGALSLVLVCLLHSRVETWVLESNSEFVMVLDIIFIIYFCTDTYESAKQAFDLRKIIDEQILKNETILRMEKRLDVILAFAADDRAKLKERMERYQARALKILKRNPSAMASAYKVKWQEMKALVENHILSKK